LKLVAGFARKKASTRRVNKKIVDSTRNQRVLFSRYLAANYGSPRAFSTTIYPSIHPRIYLHLSIYLSTYLTIYPSIDPSLSLYLLSLRIYLSVYASTKLFICVSNYRSISSIQLSFYRSTDLSFPSCIIGPIQPRRRAYWAGSSRASWTTSACASRVSTCVSRRRPWGVRYIFININK